MSESDFLQLIAPDEEIRKDIGKFRKAIEKAARLNRLAEEQFRSGQSMSESHILEANADYLDFCEKAAFDRNRFSFFLSAMKYFKNAGINMAPLLGVDPFVYEMTPNE